MNKELLMDLINKDIEKSYQFILTLRPRREHQQVKQELDELKQEFLTKDYEIIKKSSDYAIDNFLSKLANNAKNNQGVEISSSDLFLPFFIYVKLFAYLKKYEINEQFILMMYRDLDTAKNFTTAVSMKNTAKEAKSEEMTAKALKRHAPNREKENVAKEQIKNIWRENNWASYTQCADHIRQHRLIEGLGYRKVLKIVSQVAKERH